MRRLPVLFLMILSACTAAQEPVPTTGPLATTSTVAREPTTTTTSIASTSTTAPAPTTTTTTLPPLQGLAYEEVARMDFPIQMVPWGPVPAVVATKDGRVWLYDGQGVSDHAVLDIRDQVRNQGEQGLLSVAVHPDDTNRFFVHYSANDGDTVVSEFTWDNESLVDELVLLRLDQPAGNHNGGMIQFGPDGALYVGLGDGGGANDRYGNGQNTDTLLGGLVRIDVDGGADPELFQYGLRNPWRFWIDGDTIYIADVGQNAFEEISVSPLTGGVNYGWPITEALHCFRPSTGCDTAGLTLPVVEVAHGDAGTRSITGGVVYRGSAIPELEGTFLFSDYGGGYLRGLLDGEVTDFTDQVGVPGPVVSFGVDDSGEVYVMTTDRLLQLVPLRG